VAVLATVLVAGCSGDATPSSKPSPTSSVAAGQTRSATPSPSPTVEPAPVAPDPVNSAAGQRAFARHVMDLWAFALRTNDAEPLVALGRGTACAGCTALQRELARRSAAGWTVDLAGVDVRRIALSKRGGSRLARATVDIPASDSFNTDGTFRNTNPAHTGATFEVRMRFVDGGYRLLSFTVS